MNRLKEVNTFIDLCDEWEEAWRYAPAHDIVYLTKECFLEYYKYAPFFFGSAGRYTTLRGIPFSVVDDVKPFNGTGDNEQKIKPKQRILFR